MDDSRLQFVALQEALAGTWSLESELGRGGMGTVYLAREAALDRPVAIKVLHPALAERPEQRERFLREARTGARLSHPHIVPIYAVGETAGFIYFVMGLVDGESVADRLQREGPLPSAEAERVLREIGWALAYAHAAGILHRDITLDNILVERRTGRTVLVDFGIATETERAGEAPLLGTPAVLAPELIRGEPPSPQSDLYALGVAGWAVLAGRYPFVGDDTTAVLLAHATAPIPSLAAAAPATSPRVVRAIERCLSKEVAQRPADAEALLSDLARPGERRTIAPALERWVTRGSRIRPLWAFACSIFAVTTADRSLWLWSGGWHLQWDLIVPLVTYFGGASALQMAFEVRELRRVQQAGYTVLDVRSIRRIPPSDAGSRDATLVMRLVRACILTGVGFFAVVVVVINPHYRVLYDIFGRPWLHLGKHIAEVGKWLWLALWAAIGAKLILASPTTNAGPFGRLADRFWNSRFAAWIAKLASWGLSRGQPAEHTLHRPTELVLDLAIDELWAALPDGSRAEFDAVPALADALRERVGEARELLQHLDRPGMQHSTETDSMRERLTERQQAGVRALEQLRIQLARLAGHAAPTGELTNHLRAARGVEAGLLAELGADANLLRRLNTSRRVTPRTLTPTPTPRPT